MIKVMSERFIWTEFISPDGISDPVRTKQLSVFLDYPVAVRSHPLPFDESLKARQEFNAIYHLRLEKFMKALHKIHSEIIRGPVVELRNSRHLKLIGSLCSKSRKSEINYNPNDMYCQDSFNPHAGESFISAFMSGSDNVAFNRAFVSAFSCEITSAARLIKQEREENWGIMDEFFSNSQGTIDWKDTYYYRIGNEQCLMSQSARDKKEAATKAEQEPTPNGDKPPSGDGMNAAAKGPKEPTLGNHATPSAKLKI